MPDSIEAKRLKEFQTQLAPCVSVKNFSSFVIHCVSAYKIQTYSSGYTISCVGTIQLI